MIIHSTQANKTWKGELKIDIKYQEEVFDDFHLMRVSKGWFPGLDYYDFCRAYEIDADFARAFYYYEIYVNGELALTGIPESKIKELKESLEQTDELTLTPMKEV